MPKKHLIYILLLTKFEAIAVSVLPSGICVSSSEKLCSCSLIYKMGMIIHTLESCCRKYIEYVICSAL